MSTLLHSIILILFSVSCPPGTYYSVAAEECLLCEEGSWQHLEGQESCTPCANDSTSPAGAYTMDMCKYCYVKGHMIHSKQKVGQSESKGWSQLVTVAQ